MENKLIAKGITTDLNSYTFSIKDEPIIVITENGFKYKGELIEDKGEIYQLLKNYITQQEISDEEIEKWAKEYTCKEYEKLIFDYENYDKYRDFVNGAKKYREQLIMTSERIKEIQQQTAYPDSISVQQALLQVWNECSQLTKQEMNKELIGKDHKRCYRKMK
jgi:hypothetical protein